MEKINLFDFIKHFKYISFVKKQIIYFLNPIKYFKEEVLNKKDKDGIH